MTMDVRVTKRRIIRYTRIVIIKLNIWTRKGFLVHIARVLVIIQKRGVIKPRRHFQILYIIGR
jgi:hypothetical protein